MPLRVHTNGTHMDKRLRLSLVSFVIIADELRAVDQIECNDSIINN